MARYQDAENTDGEPQGTSSSTQLSFSLSSLSSDPILKSDPLTHRSDDEGDEGDEVAESLVAAEAQESTAQESTSGAGSSGPNYVDREGFIAVASAAMGQDLSNESTQALQHLYDFRNAYETPPLAASSRDSSVRTVFIYSFNK
jgi:hypothetical protein